VAVEIPPRSAIPAEHRWSTESIFESDASWEAGCKEAEGRLAHLAGFRGRLGEGPETLAEWFDALEDMLERVGKIYVYASMFHNADTADQDAVAKHDRAQVIFSRATATVAFAEPELLSIGFDRLRRWVAEEPRLGHLGHYLDDLERKQRHVRSAEVEEVLGRLTDPFHSARAIHGILADADLVFRPASTARGAAVEVAQGSIDALLADPDRTTRRTAWESYADAHHALRNTMAGCLSTCVKQHVFQAMVRGHASCLEAALAEDNIPVSVFHALLEAFRRHLPTWHRYFRLRREVLGYDSLHPYDLKAPLSPARPVVPYEQAVAWILEGMAPLGREYVEALARGLGDERWVDRRPSQGKRAGAFSTGWPGTRPFVLMSYNDDVFSLSTLAHELGHSMHSLRTWASQRQIYAHYSIFVAEVASNFNQAMVRAYLLEQNPDPEFQVAVIEEAMANFHRYLFLMPTLARFELEIHDRAFRGEALTAEGMCNLMRDLFAEGYGGEVAVDDARVGITWAEFPTHLYANFYVYQYATGIAAAHALVQAVKSGAASARERYLGFLAAGNSAYPIDVLSEAGVDLTRPEAVEAAFRALSGMVDRLAALVRR